MLIAVVWLLSLKYREQQECAGKGLLTPHCSPQTLEEVKKFEVFTSLLNYPNPFNSLLPLVPGNHISGFPTPDLLLQEAWAFITQPLPSDIQMEAS